MFRLIKILGTGEHLPEPKRIFLQEPITAKRGTPLAVRNGRAVLFGRSAVTEGAPDHILMRDAENQTEILAAVLPDGALFAVPLCAEASAAPTVGARVTPDSETGSIDPTAPVDGVWAAVVYDDCGATSGGDEILVIFPNHI